MRPRIASSQAVTPSSGMRKRIAPSSSYAAPSATRRAPSSRQRSIASSWNVTGPSQSIPSQESERWIWSTASATSRLVSVFSMRSRHYAASAREEPVEEEGVDRPDVEEPGRRRRHADADAHRGRHGSQVVVDQLRVGRPGRANRWHERGRDEADERDRERPHNVGWTPIRAATGPAAAIPTGMSTNQPSASYELTRDCACAGTSRWNTVNQRARCIAMRRRRGTTPRRAARPGRRGRGPATAGGSAS